MPLNMASYQHGALSCTAAVLSCLHILDHVLSFMSLRGKPTNDMKAVKGFFTSCQPADFNAFAKDERTLYCTDVHAGQALYTPPGFLFHECARMGTDLVGAKAVVFLSAPSPAEGDDTQVDLKSSGDVLVDVSKSSMQVGLNGGGTDILQAAKDALAR